MRIGHRVKEQVRCQEGVPFCPRNSPERHKNTQNSPLQPLKAPPTLNKSDTCITENTMMAIPAAKIGANITNPNTGATNRANNGAANEQTKSRTKQLGMPIRIIFACRARSYRFTYPEAFFRKSSKQIKCPNPLNNPIIANNNWPPEGPWRKGAGRNGLLAP